MTKRTSCEEPIDCKRAKIVNHAVCVNTIRCLAVDMVGKANSGHPGAPMGCAPIAHALWGHTMTFSPKHPQWMNRDRFVLSNGHGCTLQYSMLHLTGYNLSMDDLKNFRQIHSKTPGHPENEATEGVEVCTGPLAQGISQAVGMAIAQEHLAARFNKPDFELFNNYTYVICGDGCMMEGVSSEASSLAGHLQLKKLIVFYDDNNITIDGNTDLAFTEDVGKRYEAYGWHVLHVNDGDNTDPGALLKAVEKCKAQDKPSFILVKTTIGIGSLKEGTAATHGAPLSAADITQLKEKFGFEDKPFQVSDGVRSFYSNRGTLGDEAAAAWNELLAKYATQYPTEHAELQRRMKGEMPANWKDVLPKYSLSDKPKATRQYGGEVLKALLPIFPELIGGSADLTPSNLTKQGDVADMQKSCYGNRYIRFGVREHAMSAICNGMFAYGMFRPFCATFLNFIGYSWGATRLSALSGFGIIYVGTHDSIDLGEDGPTHQPIEMLPLVRSTPNMMLVRPCDGNETSGAYAVAMEHPTTPTVLALTRGAVTNLANTSIDAVAKGAYVLNADSDAVVTLTGSGSEVCICDDVAKRLREAGVKCRVVSMPCWELFEKQSDEYKMEVFPKGQMKVYVEASSTFGCDKYADVVIGMTTFGASAPAKNLRTHFGFTSDNVYKKTVEGLHARGLAENVKL